MVRVLDTIRNGELRTRVTFKSQPEAQDTVGNVQVLNLQTDLTTWGDRAVDVPCKYEAIRGVEVSEVDKTVSLLYATLTMHYDPNMVPVETDAVVCDGKIYGVTAVYDPTGKMRARMVDIREVK